MASHPPGRSTHTFSALVDPVDDASTSVPAHSDHSDIPPRAYAVSVALFVVAGLLEIGGGWCVWQTVKARKHWSVAVVGVIMLAVYGVVPCFQPDELSKSNFGRVYAAYGGFFIALSYAWGRFVDNETYDAGDIVGATLALVGVGIAWCWPR